MPMLKLLNPNSEIAKSSRALAVNISAAKGLLEVMKGNLGPKGTSKLLVSGSGDIKLTKDGNVLLNEMQIKHPTASLIAKAAVAQDEMTGDGTTTIVLLVGEMLKQAENYITEGLHPTIITDGFEVAKKKCLKILDDMRRVDNIDKETLTNVAQTALRSKLNVEIADLLTNIVVEAVTRVKDEEGKIDLHRVEIMEMRHKTETDTMLVKGLVLDHGARHPNMPKRVSNAYILTCNVSLEYEKTEVNSGFFYNTAAEREQMIKSERKFIDDRVDKIIALKRKVCDQSTGDAKKKAFVLINQKGIDPYALDMLAKEGIMALRRAKKRNMERLVLACSGKAVNSLEDLSPECLGYAGLVYEHILGEDKFTFVEDCKNPKSVTILIKGPAKYIITQMRDAVKDGLRAVKNAIEEGIVPGAGAFYITCYKHLRDLIDGKYDNKPGEEDIKGKIKLGIEAYAQALLIVPRTLALNSGFDMQGTIIACMEEGNNNVGIDLDTGLPIKPNDLGIWDNYNVIKHSLYSSTVIASNILLVDEMLAAGISTLKK
ncbi:unnamed protein product [Gordionus sp. m RMFG-2023]|uniref:T-complex protein 1 subunit zeta-like isoform X1 n=1 Tax=Gordionus sp. m RMFG-2023 TaxID=3053472 RepID=UPI0030E39BF6